MGSDHTSNRCNSKARKAQRLLRDAVMGGDARVISSGISLA